MGFHTIIYAILLYVQQNKNLTRYSYDSNAVTMGNIGRHIIQIILVSSCTVPHPADYTMPDNIRILL